MELEIRSILNFNIRRRILVIILLQSVTIQFRRLFWHTSYYKVRQSNFITKRDRLSLHSVSGITKCDRLYCKVRQVLRSVTVIAKWNVTWPENCETWHKSPKSTDFWIQKKTFSNKILWRDVTEPENIISLVCIKLYISCYKWSKTVLEKQFVIVPN